MRIIKTIRLISTFYKGFLLSSLLITACCLGISWEYGYSVFPELFWFKIGTLGLTLYFINSYKHKEYYYYQNLGVSRFLLWAITLSFDFSIFVLLIFFINKFR